VELQLHGGPGVCRSVAAALGSLSGLRAAAPGEFTRRALLNGKLDLAQVEGVSDLLAAETAAQTRQAIALMDGALSASAGLWRDRLLRALALVEASVDFAEEDVPAAALDEARELLADVARRFEAEIAGSNVAERLRAGFEVALVGAPNVGKSTLLNTIAGREAALTSEVAGTTRDVIEVRLELEGLPVTIVDMAGLRATDDPVETLGVARARHRAQQADLRVFLVEDGVCHALGVDVQPGDLVLLAKADLLGAPCEGSVSGLTGEGVEPLLQRLVAELSNRAASAGLINRERHRQALARALDSIESACAWLGPVAPQLELGAADISAALRALDFLVGRVDVESVLDKVFSSFCIGK
ncbi:MAG: tRNA uridine-5-carboxymethylaminomethyl(34) synthesis GTPase MnmE, partial [Rhodobacteraceae bacterium]|nr:tRNA uridine-5-carboxymethylaminomethyl(34) synthesis GTPase MnmE [Paracoccaceae bacterium]